MLRSAADTLLFLHRRTEYCAPSPSVRSAGKPKAVVLGGVSRSKETGQSGFYVAELPSSRAGHGLWTLLQHRRAL